MFQELGDGIFRRRYESLDFNVGVVLGEDGVLIVDTRMNHIEADEVKADLVGFTQLPVRWVVNTHWHWDHAFGNSRFSEAEIWGHTRTKEVLEAEADAMKSGAKQWLDPKLHDSIDDVEIVAPTMTFSDRVSLDIGRPVELSFHGLGHTDADIEIQVDEVAFLGDLIEEGAPPSFGDSYPLGWPGTLGNAVAEGAEIMVPGHGDVVDRSFVEGQLQELFAVADLATRCIEGDLTITEASALGPYSPAVMRSALERAVAVAKS